MNFPNRYKVLMRNEFVSAPYRIVPIRYEDRLLIMKWRNEQIYHLRQSRPLTVSDQDLYFRDVVLNLFNQEKPSQLLFSYLKDDEIIGYGGLVHINWHDKNAELSFIMDTRLEGKGFREHWQRYLKLIEQVAFHELGFHKIFTYAFDLRPHLYDAIESVGFKKEAALIDHCFFNNEFKDVVIHTKFNRYITIRRAEESDAETVYAWANDASTRENSFSAEHIKWDSHETWWKSKMGDPMAEYFIAEVKGEPAGVVRFDIKADNRALIGINISPSMRGKGYSNEILSMACNEFLTKHLVTVDAFIKASNLPSIKLFERSGFVQTEETFIHGVRTFKYEL